jgi:hypothetical protein
MSFKELRCVGDPVGDPVGLPKSLVFDTIVLITARCETRTSPLSALGHRTCINGKKHVCQLPRLVVGSAPLHFERARPPSRPRTASQIRMHHCLLQSCALRRGCCWFPLSRALFALGRLTERAKREGEPRPAAKQSFLSVSPPSLASRPAGPANHFLEAKQGSPLLGWRGGLPLFCFVARGISYLVMTATMKLHA